MNNQKNHGYEHLGYAESQTITSLRERFCMHNFTKMLNEHAGYNKYEVEDTPVYISCAYDCTLKVYNKKRELIKYFLVEVKVREETYSDYFLEKLKKDELLKAKEEKDLILKSKGLNLECGILYVNFTYCATILWDVLYLIETGIIKRGTRKLMNDCTIMSRDKKKLKSVYTLKPHQGIYYTDYIFNGHAKRKFIEWYEEQKQPKKKEEPIKSKWTELKSLFD